MSQFKGFLALLHERANAHSFNIKGDKNMKAYLICGWFMIVLGVLALGMMVFPIIKGRTLHLNPFQLGIVFFGGAACLFRYYKAKN